MNERVCRHEPPCEALPLDRAQFCADHIGLPHRCVAERMKDGRKQRCKNTALAGTTGCLTHGGRFPSNKALSERSKALTAMQRFVRPREGSTTLMQAFDEEFRRTLGRIDWLQEAIGGLSDPDSPEDYKALIWGKTKSEDIGAGQGKDFQEGTNTTYEARVHVLEDMLRWERVHLLNIEKLGIGAGLEQQRLDMLKTYSMRVQTMMETALDLLGIDPHDPAVLKALERAFQPDRPEHPILDIEAIEGPLPKE